MVDTQFVITIMGGREVSRPYQQKKHRFHPLKQDKIGTIIFQFHFTDPITDPTDPADPSDPSDLSDTKSISEIYHQPCKTVRSVRTV